MTPNRIFFKALFLSGVFVVNIPGAHLAQSANNTGSNQGAQVDKQNTAEQQAETPKNAQTTQDIRRAIIKDKSLSFFAQKIEVITKTGMTTLKGLVRSEKEKRAIEAIAVRIAGVAAITSEMTVAPR